MCVLSFSQYMKKVLILYRDNKYFTLNVMLAVGQFNYLWLHRILIKKLFLVLIIFLNFLKILLFKKTFRKCCQYFRRSLLQMSWVLMNRSLRNYNPLFRKTIRVKMLQRYWKELKMYMIILTTNSIFESKKVSSGNVIAILKAL